MNQETISLEFEIQEFKLFTNRLQVIKNSLKSYCPRCTKEVPKFTGYKGDKILGYCKPCGVQFTIYDMLLDGDMINSYHGVSY